MDTTFRYCWCIGLILGVMELAGWATATAQHPIHHQDSTRHVKHRTAADTAMHENSDTERRLSHTLSRQFSMSRHGSGTGWLPDASLMHGYMFHTKKWMYMVHGNIFLRYNWQDIREAGSRGDEKFDAPNWLMGMGQTSIGNSGLFRVSAMISLDPPAVGGEGYPLLFQSGETWNGSPLVDRQHPHDLFSELAVSYVHMLSSQADLSVYLGYPGEPAFGPVAFMHRPSSLYNPDAPLGHHWQDATHITFGVGTLGVRYQNLKLEGSLFTGREPNEDRYGWDRPRFDSWSVRLSYNPSAAWALQTSQAWVKDLHAIGPREDVDKTSLSVIHVIGIGPTASLHTTAVWGLNNTDGHSGQHSLLLESALNVHATTIYGKYEWVEKSTGDLLLNEEEFGHDAIFPVNALTLGIHQGLGEIVTLKMASGLQSSLYITPNRLEPLYGQHPVAVEIYLRIFPDIVSEKES